MGGKGHWGRAGGGEAGGPGRRHGRLGRSRRHPPAKELHSPPHLEHLLTVPLEHVQSLAEVAPVVQRDGLVGGPRRQDVRVVGVERDAVDLGRVGLGGDHHALGFGFFGGWEGGVGGGAEGGAADLGGVGHGGDHHIKPWASFDPFCLLVWGGGLTLLGARPTAPAACRSPPSHTPQKVPQPPPKRRSPSFGGRRASHSTSCLSSPTLPKMSAWCMCHATSSITPLCSLYMLLASICWGGDGRFGGGDR